MNVIMNLASVDGFWKGDKIFTALVPHRQYVLTLLQGVHLILHHTIAYGIILAVI